MTEQWRNSRYVWELLSIHKTTLKNYRIAKHITGIKGADGHYKYTEVEIERLQTWMKNPMGDRPIASGVTLTLTDAQVEAMTLVCDGCNRVLQAGDRITILIQVYPTGWHTDTRCEPRCP